MRRLILVAFIAAIQSAVAKSADSPLGRAIEDIPEALRLIRTANDVYVLPVTLTEDRERRVTPRGDFRHLRPDRRRRPSKAAAFARHRKKLVPRVGRHHQRRLRPSHCSLIFHKGEDRLVLLCGLGLRLKGTFNREPTGGSLEDKPADKLDKWKKQYAKPELGIK